MKIKTSTIDELCNVEYGTRVTRKKDEGKIYPVYGGGGETFFIDKTNRKNRVVIARFAISTKCTRYIEGNFFLNDSGLTLSPKTNELSQQYLDKIILTLNDAIYRLGRGTAQRNLDMKQFRMFKISYPKSLTEQNNIVCRLDTAFAEVGKMEISLKKNKNEINNLFDSYVLKYFKKDNTNKEIKPLKDLCENYRNDIVDGPFGSNLKSKDFTDKGMPVLKIQNVKEFLINNKKMVYVSKTKFEKLKRHSFKKGDIVMTKLGEPLGVSAIIENLESGLIVADLIRIRANKINTEFLCFQLNSSENRKYINSMQKGTTRARITLSVIRELPVYCPDKNEQEKILKKIKSIKSDIFKLEKIYLQKENNLKTLKSSLLNNFLTKINVV